MQLFKNKLIPPFDYLTFVQTMQNVGFLVQREADTHLVVFDSPLNEDTSLQLVTNFQHSDKSMDANFRHFRLYQYSKSQDAYIGESYFIKVDESAIEEIKKITEKITNRFVRGVYLCLCGKKYMKSVRTANGNIFSCLGSDCESITLTQQELLLM